MIPAVLNTILMINFIVTIFHLEFKDFARPKDWKKDLWELDIEHPENNGLQNEDLIVWMRTAALPNFRKLYRKIDHQNNGEDFMNGIPEGHYSLDIEYSKNLRKFCQLAD